MMKKPQTKVSLLPYPDVSYFMPCSPKLNSNSPMNYMIRILALNMLDVFCIEHCSGNQNAIAKFNLS